MNNNAKYGNSRKIYIWTAVVLAVFIFAFAMYHKGYRIKNNFAIGKVGTVILQIPMPLTSVYVDNSQKITTSKDNQTVTVSLSPRKHTIIVAHDGYFPWKKDFTVPSEGTLTLSPLFVSQNASGQIITTKDPEYNSIRETILKALTPTKSLPKTSVDKSKILWLDQNGVFVEDATVNASSTMQIANLVVKPDTIVKNADFYKDRNDVIIFASGNSIYAIETDVSGGQNFMPIYKGEDPTFITTPYDYIYVLDGDNLMQVII